MKGDRKRRGAKGPTRLTKRDVLRLARLQGLPLEAAEEHEVRYRLNALAEALEELDQFDLAQVDPLPILVQQEGD